MPRYFFDFQDSQINRDDEGAIFSDPSEALSKAVVVLGELLRDHDGQFWQSPEWRMHVRDERGDTLGSITVTGRLERAH